MTKTPCSKTPLKLVQQSARGPPCLLATIPQLLHMYFTIYIPPSCHHPRSASGSYHIYLGRWAIEQLPAPVCDRA
jgi:hypothetical protein